MSQLDNIKEKTQNIKSELININQEIRKLRNENFTETRQNKRKQPKLTNNEIATADYPLDSEIEENNIISIPQKSANQLKSSLMIIQKEMIELDNLIGSDFVNMSSSLDTINNQIFTIKDELECSVYKNFDINNDPIILNYLIINQNRSYILKSDKEEFENEIDNLERLSKTLKNRTEDIIGIVSNIDEEDIKKEIDETREKRMRDRFEQEKPYMDLNRIKDLYDVGDIITVSEFRDKMSHNSKHNVSFSKNTVLEILENAKDVTPDYDGYNVIKIKDDKYKIKKEQ